MYNLTQNIVSETFVHVWFFKFNKKSNTKVYSLQGNHFSLSKLVPLLSAKLFIHGVKVCVWQSDKSYWTRTVELGKLFFALVGLLRETSRNIFTLRRISNLLLYSRIFHIHWWSIAIFLRYKFILLLTNMFIKRRKVTKARLQNYRISEPVTKSGLQSTFLKHYPEKEKIILRN